jgi:hypothetical protein
MRNRLSEEYDHRDRPQNKVPVHERSRFPQEQRARQGHTEELDEPAYRRELISESVCNGVMEV